MAILKRQTSIFDTAIAIGSSGTLTFADPPTSPMQVLGLPVYADNAAAVAGGLVLGEVYRTSLGAILVCLG